MKTGDLKIFDAGNKRTSLVKRNIVFSFILKGGSVVITFLLVPLTINYINPVQYGIWLTLSSLIYWINIFDIGIGNGLKNEIASSLALNDTKNLKKYVSTCYALLSIIAIFLFLTFLITSFFINWNGALNISDKINYDIRPVLIIVLGFFCLQFVVQIIDAILSATQQVFKSSVILFFGQLIGLIIIYILTLFVPGSLFILVVVMSGSSVAVLVIASLYLFRTELKAFAPGFAHIDFSYCKKLLNIGAPFFLIQVGAMILIYSNNFIITRILGPEAVTVYNIPFRLFSFISMVFAIIIMPYWSAFTDAYATKDMEWIKRNIKKLRMTWLFLSLLGVAIFILSNVLYKIWIQDAVIIPVSVSLCMLIYVIAYTWQTLHVYFLNGIGKIRLQLFVVVAGALLNIPLSVLLGRKFGLPGVIGANTIIFIIMGIIFTIQYDKIIKQSALKIWNK